MPEGVQAVLEAPLTRRSFMKWSGVAGGAAVATGVAVRYGLMPLPAEAATRTDDAGTSAMRGRNSRRSFAMLSVTTLFAVLFTGRKRSVSPSMASS